MQKFINSLRTGGQIIYTFYEASNPDGINTPEALNFKKETLKLLQMKQKTKINNLNPYVVVIKNKS